LTEHESELDAELGGNFAACSDASAGSDAPADAIEPAKKNHTVVTTASSLMKRKFFGST
jgi:hypothetical protein